MAKPEILIFFLREYKWKTLLLYLSQLLSSVLEGVGIAALLPLFSIIMDIDGSHPSAMIHYFSEIFKAIHLDLNLENLLFVIITIFVCKAILRYGIAYYMAHLFSQIVLDFRKRLINAMLYSEWAFYIYRPSGHFLNALFVEAQRCGGLYRTLGMMVSSSLQILSLLVVAYLLSFQVALAGIGVGLLLWLLFYRYVRMAGEAGTQEKDAAKSIHAHMGDILQNFKPLKAMHAEESVFQKLQRGMRSLHDISVRQAIVKDSMVILQEPLLVIIISGGLFINFRYIQIDAPTLLVFMGMFYRLITSWSLLQQNYQVYCGQRSFFGSYMDLVEEAKKHNEGYQPGRDHDLKNCITFENVSFAYGTKQVLKNLNVTIPSHCLVGLVGPSGTGKTTVLDLICRLYTPQSGSIKVDGISIELLDLYKWRNKIGYIPQEFVIFHDTVLNNITLGDPSISERDVINTLKKAEAWEFVNDLADGLHTNLGERGGRLSGGQRQRISIARALIRKPQLLIMDEATASLDANTEREIFATMKLLTKETTIIAISHQKGLKDSADILIDLTQE